jgi:hypothetical protein
VKKTLLISTLILISLVGCGGDATQKSSKKSESSSSMMLNAKMIDQARGIVADENKKSSLTLDDLEKKE